MVRVRLCEPQASTPALASPCLCLKPRPPPHVENALKSVERRCSGTAQDF